MKKEKYGTVSRSMHTIVRALSATLLSIASAHAADTQTAPAFMVAEYRVLGNSVLSAREVETAIYPFVGPEKQMTDVEAARTALENAYHAKGFGTVFVDIPEQSVDEGIVRLHVMEGKLRAVRVNGARYFSNRQIRSSLPTAHENAVPDLPKLQTELTALNMQTRDRVVVPVLKAGPVPGTVDLTLKVEDHLPAHASLEVNNQYSADTKPLRAMGSVSYDHLFARFDSIGLQYQLAVQEPKQVSVLVASYSTKLTDSGLRGAFYFVDSDNDVATLGALNVLGKGKIYGAKLIKTLSATSAGVHSLTFGLDYKDFKQDIQLATDSTLSTPISYSNFSVGYSGVGHMGKHQWGLDGSLNLGPRGLGNSDQEFADKRFKATPNYFYARGEASFAAALPKNMSLAFRLGGQYAAEPVISNEQFTIGGADSVRGYLEAEELGDMGAKASVQLNSPQFGMLARQVLMNGFVFFDAARVSVNEPLGDEATRASLRSWGVGLDLIAYEHFTAGLTWAYPLLDASRTLAGDSRLLFTIRSSW